MASVNVEAPDVEVTPWLASPLVPAVTWPELAYRFPATAVTSRPLVRDGVELARVHGISYATRDVSRNLAATFRRDEGETFAIGLLHANVGGKHCDTSARHLRRAIHGDFPEPR